MLSLPAISAFGGARIPAPASPLTSPLIDRFGLFGHLLREHALLPRQIYNVAVESTALMPRLKFARDCHPSHPGNSEHSDETGYDKTDQFLLYFHNILRPKVAKNTQD